MAELEQVLNRAKFRRWLTIQEAARFVADFRILADMVDDPPPTSGTTTADPGDDFLVALAYSADIATLISGDPHLTSLVLDPPVLTPATFLARVGG